MDLPKVKRKLRGDAEVAKREHSLSCNAKNVHREFHCIPTTFKRGTASCPWYTEATKLAKSALRGVRTHLIMSPSLTWNEAGIHEIANYINYAEHADNCTATLLGRQ